jgi:arginine decarboxylase
VGRLFVALPAEAAMGAGRSRGSRSATQAYLEQQKFGGTRSHGLTVAHASRARSGGVARVYQTNSTHKSMSAPPGSMALVETRTTTTVAVPRGRVHASTSPNLQIIASLDVARRQMEPRMSW